MNVVQVIESLPGRRKDLVTDWYDAFVHVRFGRFQGEEGVVVFGDVNV